MLSRLYYSRVNQATGTTLWSVSSLNEVVHNHGQSYHRPSQNYQRPPMQIPINGQAKRIQVYIDNVWAIPLPDTAGRFRYSTSAFNRNDSTQMHRLHEFILRDVVAIRETTRLDGLTSLIPGHFDMIAATSIMLSLEAYDIRHIHFLNALRALLDTHSVHFYHELYNFVNSPYEISDYDRNVQHINQPHDTELTAPFYQEQPPPIHTVSEIIELHSDNEELQRSNIIEDSSSNVDSNIEILSRSTDQLNSTSIDQPSTSTRDSLGIPNNSSQSINTGLSQESNSSSVKRGRPNLDTLSDDEESIIDTQGSQTAHLQFQDFNKKKKDKHQ